MSACVFEGLVGRGRGCVFCSRPSRAPPLARTNKKQPPPPKRSISRIHHHHHALKRTAKRERALQRRRVADLQHAIPPRLQRAGGVARKRAKQDAAERERVERRHALVGGQLAKVLVEQLLNGAWCMGLGAAVFKKRLLEKLAAAGYSFTETNANQEPLWSVAEEVWFKVDSSFPVIRHAKLEKHVRDRVSELSYSLSLAGLEPGERPAFD